MVVFPNAKINIGLNILNKREDGFHTIESVFLPVDICDVLEFIESDGETTFHSTGIEIPGNPEENLCLQAWRMLKDDYTIPSVQIHLHKHIPIGAGLGGGSADGAFMLKALNSYFELNIDNDKLKEYAAQMGSDCPFFIDNRPCYVTGRGEILESFELNLSEFKILLVYPNIHIGTKEAYSNVAPAIPEKSLKKLLKTPVNEWQKAIKNDFEVSVFPNHRELPAIKDELITMGAEYASLTGSGSAIYGIFSKTQEIPESNLLKQFQVYSTVASG